VHTLASTASKKIKGAGVSTINHTQQVDTTKELMIDGLAEIKRINKVMIIGCEFRGRINS
jgi:hypothetical protein